MPNNTNNITVDKLSQELSNMSLSTPTIHAAKAIAEFLPIFDGNSLQLESFIDACDNFHNNYGRTVDNNLNHFTYVAIRSRLRNEVANHVMCRPDLNTWPLIKNALREQYGDRIDRQTLTREFLQMRKNRNENIIDFIQKIKQMKSRLEIKINSDNTLSPDNKKLLIEHNELNSLDVLLVNVDDKLRTILDIKSPKSLNEACDVVMKHFYNEQRINSLQENFNRNTNNNSKPKLIEPQQRFMPQNLSNFSNMHFNNNPLRNPPQFYQSFQHSPQYSVQQTPPTQFRSNYSQFPSAPINIQPRQIERRFPTNSQVFGKPKNVFAPKNNYTPNNKPTPMSITSKIPSAKINQNRNNYFQSRGPANFISEELTNVETDVCETPYKQEITCENQYEEQYQTEDLYQEQYQYDQFYENTSYPDHDEYNQNFHLTDDPSLNT